MLGLVKLGTYLFPYGGVTGSYGLLTVTHALSMARVTRIVFLFNLIQFNLK